jgi:uncharacterized membrane protein YfcA
VEKVLVNLDIGIPGALLRVVLGYFFVSIVEVVRPGAGLGTLSAWLLVALFAVKVAAAAGRRAAPASADVRAHWEWRRNLARYYDSYQWRKLVWFGIGIMIGAAMGSPGTRQQWILGLVCFAAGAAAEPLWRRHRLALARQVP